ncbi:flippase [Enterococcus rivorum]|uniref:Uncharacterized protein n=1 Tax=Enterococcus rivorum TaxID=762845 RepID=A0A1E5KX66_9ENTE|nr:flippase [Enterococcus rivorum]MBP2097197.1 O-antigen/teichoic acid export membrane protein [Enterococcus rivorum]OEH82446.1 hypothetical protein BCR26_03160 [Enterococcus rivorum]
MKTISIKKNAVLNTLRTLLNVIFPLITYPYIARVLHVENIGKYDFSKSIVSYFILIAGFGIAQYGVREGSGIRDNKKELDHFCSEIFSLNIVTTIVAYVFIFFLIFVGNLFEDYQLLIMIFSLNILGTTLSVEWLYTLEEDFQYITLRSLAVQIISLFCMFLFVKETSDYLKYALITVFSFSGSSVFNYYHAKKYVNLKFTFRINWKKHLPRLTIFFFNSLASMIYLNSDITILGILKGNYFVGIYSTATKIYTIFKQLANSVLLVAVPRLSFYVMHKEIKKYSILLNKILNMIILAILPMSLGIIFLRVEIVNLVAGVGYEQSVHSLAVLSITSIFSLLSAFFVYGVLLPYKQEKKVLVATIVSAIVNIILNFITIPYIEEVGAALSTLIAEFLVLVLTYAYSKKYISKIDIKSSMIISFFGSILIGIICVGIARKFDSVLVQLVFSVILSLIGYSGILLVSKNKYFLSLLPSIKRK